MKKKLYPLSLFLTGLFWTVAIIVKMRNPVAFLGELSLQPFPKDAAMILLYLLPILQLLIIVLLFSPAHQIKALTLSILLLLIFSIYIVLAQLHFFRFMPCSCAGFYDGWMPQLLLNFSFIIINLTAIQTHPDHHDRSYSIHLKRKEVVKN